MKTASALLLALTVFAQQKYTGPRPPKPDIPYIWHANKLVETDSGTAAQEKKKDDTIYSLPGASATARTPMPEPIFLVVAQKLNVDQMTLFKMEIKNGRRELTMFAKPKKDGPRPIRLGISKVADGLYKLEAQEQTENGEYCLSPEGSNQVFCFTVY